MRRTLVAFLFLFLSVPIYSAYAHGGGFSVVEVNGKSALRNPRADDITNPRFSVGKDSAPEVYLANQQIIFSLEEDLIPSPSSLYEWNFGDGSAAATGLNVRHSYKKIGTYFVTINDLTKLQLTVIPQKDYIFPKAMIEINGNPVGDSEFDGVEIRQGKIVSFDGSKSSGKIVKYEWDFGDGSGSDQMATSHKYTRDASFPAVAILRVTDDQGIVNDAFVAIDIPFENPDPLTRLIDAIRDWFASLFNK